MILTLWGIFNYGLVLIFGLFLSVCCVGGWETVSQRRLILGLCPVFILIQALCWAFLGEDTVRKVYPLIVHMPLTLILVFALRKPVLMSIVAVCTAYICCQLPRWARFAAEALTGSPLAGELGYTVVIVPLFFLLLRYFAGPVCSAMSGSRKSLVLFGGLPAAYYIFEYATTIYSDLLYAGIPALNELIPTALVLFYVVFLVAYHHETQERIKAERQGAAQAVLFKQAQKEMEALRKAQTQTAIYRHDMHHHLNMINVFLGVGKVDQAVDYIRRTREDITSISVKQFCENEPVNLICSSFADKAARMGISMTVSARLPEKLPVSDTELCAILSNALENALNAAARVSGAEKWVEVYCGVKQNKLLIEEKNPYCGDVAMEDGIPVSPGADQGHGYGCRSIRAIVVQNQGLYAFEPQDGIFTMQAMVPLKDR